jgi:hypothetical protein
MDSRSIGVGAIAFVAQLVFGLFAIVGLLDLSFEWLGLALACNAAGNLLGGVRTERQRPLETTG